jgi:hypothetical protein
MKERFFHFDQNMEKLINVLKASIEYHKLGVLVRSFSLTGDGIKKPG